MRTRFPFRCSDPAKRGEDLTVAIETFAQRQYTDCKCQVLSPSGRLRMTMLFLSEIGQ